MSRSSLDRRQWITQVSAAASASMVFGALPTVSAAEKPKDANSRIGIGAIGLRYQGSVITEKAAAHGDIVALADVDREILEKANSDFGGKSALMEDYRDLLARDDVDVVMIGTPDHWHTKMVIDACRAGKDVYCEKPLTLTIDEGKKLREVVKETGRVVQVGSWQRSDIRFRTAVEMVRQGWVGNLERVDIVLGKNKTGGPFETKPVPKTFNWDLWQGQTPDVPYIPERSHYTFRWWYEYSGGQMTDWGAHHIDIGQWGAGGLPVEIDGTAKMPSVENGYNVAVDYHVTYKLDNGVVLTVADEGRNGVMFTGDKGRIFVNRGTLDGAPTERKLPREDFVLYDFDNLERPERAGKLDAIINHMGNFFDCVAKRKTPVSDIESQHRSVSTCHLGNISMKLGRKLTWNPKTETFVGDDEANQHLSREQRAGYETV
ncbi:gfo/Idh/MocA family oxidoreductase [Blastopirellula marina]|uniref:Gfo/Idh/MocA family oxidoreductase n=1 Tax=Blastopirellula marina TaxID=124 RepID=A0A2S8FM25_9BACT|nr:MULTISPECIES: Gfo/Idh/MocA family oxidoreductase [Pirellulaceae]PQO33232.1 gfo/Idh/MocA family oxidoreductase [Blastopirellula marina]RCS52321.1 gfo/Idh/MocA family oxidoreductase [Bremerella cremea]